jgi:hypothetical protein
MPWKKMIYLCVAVGVVAISYLGWKLTARGAYESAEYTVLEADSLFEIREYPDLILAVTNMQFESQGNNGSFMRLFRYISGANDTEQKVAMTTPVFMETEGHDDLGQMGFVIPTKVTEQRVPEPSDKDVALRKRIGGRFAVIRYAGRMNTESVTKAEEELRQWISERGLISDGDAESAGYDPPWTPGPFRRNEILIRIESKQECTACE